MMFARLSRTRHAFSILGLSVSAMMMGTVSAMPSPMQQNATELVTIPKIKADGSNLFEVLSLTFDRVALTGERNWYSLVPKDGSAPVGPGNMRLIRYRESIAIRPKANNINAGGFYRPADFSLTLLEPGEIGAQMSDAEKNLRKAAFRDRAGFLHYQRDFRIQDAAQASKNYRVVPMGAWLNRRAVGAPRVVRIFDLLPRGENATSSSASIFRVVVDLEHQIVLDWIRFSSKGQLISALSYDKFALGVDARFSNTTWWKPWIDVQVHKSIAEASQKLGFSVAEPSKLPSGFRLLETRTAKEPILGTLYSVLIYTDGLRNFFLLQHRSDGAGALSPIKTSANSELVTVKRFRMGPVTQFNAEYKGMDYLLLGHEEEGDGVPDLLKSLVR